MKIGSDQHLKGSTEGLSFTGKSKRELERPVRESSEFPSKDQVVPGEMGWRGVLHTGTVCLSVT